MSRLPAGSFVLHCSTAMLACGDSSDAPCTRDDECSSGFCRADGTCGPTAEVDASVDAAPDAPSQLCAPNHDGQITLAEVPLAAGRMATYRFASNATFDSTGESSTNGMRRWDLSVALAGDNDRLIALAAPAGAWWAASFPSASYAATLASNSDLQGVFAIDATGLTLLGVVSPSGGTSRTELAYDPPAKILAIPFGNGTTWMSTSTVSGVALGVVTAYTEQYDSRVDQVGAMKTPYGEFPVVRIATDLTRTQGFATLLTKRTFTWNAECFGSVASMTSQDFETSSEFSDPAEVRRLVQ